jgi:UDP-N-acetylmuramoyl-tripeptide--D-alanyl-D-alanine ligase
MRRTLSEEDIRQGLDGLLVASRAPRRATFGRAVIDSRQAAPGDIFFALRGERSDGHEFVSQALSAGAAAAVVERPIDVTDEVPVFQVENSLRALQRLATYWRGRHDVRVIGVTGSVGKTTAKEVIATVLARRYSVLKTEANLNTEIGVPLTVLEMRAGHQRAVLEMAMHARGEIALLARIAQPHVGVVTVVAPVHLERLGYMGGIAAAKAELVEALPPDGLAVLNGDDARVATFGRRTRARAVLFGLSQQCDIRAQDVCSRGLEGIGFRLLARGRSQKIELPLPGRHHVYPALAAAAVALEEGMDLDEIAEALAGVRMDIRLIRRTGPAGSTIIDGSYNASPPSMLAALDLLSELPGRRIALLGEMRELGAASEDGHRRAGRRAAEVCDMLLVVGEEARIIAEEAERYGNKNVRAFASPVEAAAALKRELRAGDHVLVKGSRAVGLEEAVRTLTGDE